MPHPCFVNATIFQKLFGSFNRIFGKKWILKGGKESRHYCLKNETSFLSLIVNIESDVTIDT